LSFSSSEEDLHFLIPTNTYSKMPVTSLTEKSIPIQSDTSEPSVISPDKTLPAETSTCSKEDTPFILGNTDESPGGELGSINLQSYSPVCKAQHSQIKELGLDRVAKITPWKKKLSDRIQTRQSIVCTFRKKYMTKNL
jgi:hypothetical protein